MALIKTQLKQDIKTLLTDMRAKTDVSDDEFSDRLSTLIDNYIKSATITIPAGIPVSTAGTAAAQTGASTAPVTATIN
ncbi:MAG: hypothetical protein GY751_18210 [Bacteroidetes bacterium]|nr:hypothetical protein [Bacteroidota bacterium]